MIDYLFDKRGLDDTQNFWIQRMPHYLGSETSGSTRYAILIELLPWARIAWWIKFFLFVFFVIVAIVWKVRGTSCRELLEAAAGFLERSKGSPYDVEK